MNETGVVHVPRASATGGDGLIPPVGPGDHVWGPDDAPVTLVEYGDFECVYSRIAHPVVRACRRHLGDKLRFVFRHFPLAGIHSHAALVAEAAEAAGAQARFWEMHELLLVYQHALKQDDLVGYARTLGLDAGRFARELQAGMHAARVSEDWRSGVTSGVTGTPTFFVNGARYDGSWIDVQAFVRALHRAGQPDLPRILSSSDTSRWAHAPSASRPGS